MKKNSKSPAKVIEVSGDTMIDWNLARGRAAQDGRAAWNADDRARAYYQRGGAAMLADLIDAVARLLRANGHGDWAVRPPDMPAGFAHPGDRCYHHSYAMWRLFPYGERPPFDKEKPAWRIDEFLGLDRCPPDCDQIPQKGHPAARDEGNTAPDIVVIDDADLGFRDDPKAWPAAFGDKKRCPWILVKTAQPVAQGALWDHLRGHCNERLIAVMTIDDLRLSEVQISRELSWERTAQDLAWELIYNPRVNALSRCAHLVVSFDTAGAFLLSRHKNGPTFKLLFDPGGVEGTFAQQHRGQVTGYTVCLAAGIARQLMLDSEEPAIEQGIQNGLAAMRKLHLEGYGQRGKPVVEAGLAFPLDMIAAELSLDSAQFAAVEVQDPVRFLERRSGDTSHPPTDGYWTILGDHYTDTLDEVAEKIVSDGIGAALRNVPLGQFGKLITVDRREIEAYRSLRALIAEYAHQPRPKRPLSIAVFGAPGAGKSFGIVEVAKSLALPAPVEIKEFNLSQFGSPADILDSLHQVRDAGLSGTIPLVFWDEFDTSLGEQRLGWLRYFLAPMQDGKFQQGQIAHPIGRAIFVFAGGTSETMGAFDRGGDDKEFKAAKGPDFVSRLKGYVNILGPNPKQSADGAADPYYVIRRAILLRSILQRDAPHLFGKVGGSTRETPRIDAGVLRALLRTNRYKHGVRSMESIIAMSTLAGMRKFERSALPAEAQLDLHVDAQDFLALLQELNLDSGVLERLAAAAHGVFCDGLRAKGYRLGPRNDDKEKTNPALRPYEDLPEDLKEQNRGNVRDIANKLTLGGYVMTPARSNEPPVDFPGTEIERLAELEHERWMRLKLESGWRYGPVTDFKRKLSKALLPWRRLDDAEYDRRYSQYDGAVGRGVLPEAERKKDLLLVRGIPAMLARAGYTVVKVAPKDAGVISVSRTVATS